jgi:hypothetical protein
LFESRRSGAITVVQFPNAALWVFLAASVALLGLGPEGGWHRALVVGRDAALLIWAADEIVRGVNPFRRLLGAAVGAVTVVGIVGP